jgi:hypothetical protein
MKPVRERGSVPGSVVIHRDVTNPLPPVECRDCEGDTGVARDDCWQCWGSGLVDAPLIEDDDLEW